MLSSARSPPIRVQDTRLAAAELRSIEPRLSEGVREGLMIEGNESLDSLAFTRALAEGAQKAGTVHARATVVALRGDGRRTSRPCAPNPASTRAMRWSSRPDRGWPKHGRWFGIDLPVEPVKGEMLRLRLPGANITHDFTHGIVSLYRRGADEVWVGVTRERCGFDEAPTDEGRRTLVDAAARIMPAIRDAAVLEHLAALRPATPTGLPVVGRAPGWDNVFVANGGGIKGVLLSTGMGVAIRDLVMTGETSMPVAEFFPEETH